MKKLVKNSVTALLLAGAATLSSSPAAALDFTFTFSSDVTDPQVTNEVPGSVFGRILGLSDNATGAAAQVWIDGYTVGGFSSVPTDAAAWSSLYNNTFTVSNGVIVGAMFHSDRSFNGSYDQLWINIPLGYNNGNTNYASTGVDNVISIWNNNGVNGVTFAPLGQGVVPEPSAWALLILGFGATGAALRAARRKRVAIAYA